VGNVSAAVPHLSGCRHRFRSQTGYGKYQNQAEEDAKAQFRKRRDIARLSDKGISNAYRVALKPHLGQAEPSRDLDENAHGYGESCRGDDSRERNDNYEMDYTRNTKFSSKKRILKKTVTN